MANVLLSEAEKTFILHGVEVLSYAILSATTNPKPIICLTCPQEDFRVDGRTRRDYRPMELETGIVSHASGSARLRLANTDILVGVKTEIDVPTQDRHDEGRLEFFIDCSANATPEFEGRGGEELANEIRTTLEAAYRSRRAFDLRKLCILPRQQCWKLYVDVLILECGGNVFDAVSLAAKAALFNTRVPRVTAAEQDGGTIELQLSDDVFDCERLDVSGVPTLVTVCKIGEHCVVDPSADEEVCSAASVVVGVSPCAAGRGVNDDARVTTVRTSGAGSFHVDTLNRSVEIGLSAGACLDAELMRALHEEERKFGGAAEAAGAGGAQEVYGFLK